jgi:hypothetical protein
MGDTVQRCGTAVNQIRIAFERLCYVKRIQKLVTEMLISVNWLTIVFDIQRTVRRDMFL